MDTRWLEDFLSLSETKNFSRSARERNITQPAFSRRIRMLENWAGGQLIDRSTYPTKLTQAGENFLDGVTPVLHELHRLRDEVHNDMANQTSMVVIAAGHSLSFRILPKWLHAITSSEQPKIRIRTDSQHDCLQDLIDGNCDFFLSYAHKNQPVLPVSSRYPFLVLGTKSLVPLSAPDADGNPLHSLPGSADAPISYLAYSLECYLGTVVSSALSKIQQPHHLNACYIDTIVDSLQALAVEGLGLAWLPETSTENDLAQNKLIRAGGKEWDLPLEIRLYRAHSRRSDAAERVWFDTVDYIKGLKGSEMVC